MAYLFTLRFFPAARRAASVAQTMFNDSDAACSEDGGGPVETGTVVAEDGTVLTVTWRGVDPSLAPGTAEFRKAKRLADNRASAARSRALQRLRLNDSGVRERAR